MIDSPASLPAILITVLLERGPPGRREAPRNETVARSLRKPLRPGWARADPKCELLKPCPLSSPSRPTSDGKPACPNCGKPMLLRTARKGQKMGDFNPRK
jgi:hypothetical protein